MTNLLVIAERGITEYPDILRMKFFELVGRELLSIVLAFGWADVFLVNRIVVASMLLHEHMQQHESPCRRLIEPADGAVFLFLV
jgi:hypothetical protein